MLKREMNIADYDPQLWQAMKDEDRRQEEHIELIASENYTSPRALWKLRAPSSPTNMRKGIGQTLLRRLRICGYR